MINKLTIRRFKSIRELQLQCRRVNVLIGAPDTGKTNILEALGLLSRCGWGLPLDSSLRLSPSLGFDTLFYRQFFDKPIEILFDTETVSLSINGPTRTIDLSFESTSGRSINPVPFGEGVELGGLMKFRNYSYAGSELWSYESGYGLDEKVVFPPHGRNLMYVARHNSDVHDYLKETVSVLDWRLKFDQHQKKFVLSDVRDDEILDYNLDILSDSLKRMFFYGSTLITNRSAILIFDEPDVFAFPPYPKLLGEMIAQDETNQFFVTTHNPYFLSGVVQKTAKEHLAVFVCHRLKDGSTGAKRLYDHEVEKIIEQGASIFFNLEDFVTT